MAAPPPPPQQQPNPAPAVNPAPPAPMDPQAFAAAVAAAVQQVLNANPQVQLPAQVAPGPFAKTPSRAIPANIDLSTKAGQAIYRENTSALATTFSFAKPDIPVLLDELTVRARSANWMDIFAIPVQAGAGQTKNMLTNYGEIPYDRCRDHGTTYINTPTRAAQNNYQVFECLRATLDTESKDRLANDEERYQFGDEYDGVTYLHVILSTATAGSRATAGAIRKRLATLTEYMRDIAKDEIPVFNDYVKKQKRRLEGLGQESSDLIDHLFTAYLSVRDNMFRTYVAELQSRYDDGEAIDVPTLLEKTEARYNTYKTRQQWKMKSPEQEEIIALRAQITTLKKGANVKKKEGKDDTKAKADKDKGKQKGDQGGKGKGKRRSHTGKWAWKNNPPEDGNETKIFEGKTFKFCKLHKWAGHTTAECKVLNDPKNDAAKADASIQASLAAVGVTDVSDTTQQQ